jgi:signal transduction histidine kinase
VLWERETGCVRVSVIGDPHAETVLLRVSDNGPGMSEEVIRRCTEPYFSTKPRGGSTGMGLSFVNRLLTGAGGRLDIDSIVGQGTTVTLTLPTAEPAVRIDEIAPTRATPLR